MIDEAASEETTFDITLWGETIRSSFATFTRAFDELSAALAALPDDDLVIVRDESIERGIAKVRADGALRMHPLTALHFEHEGNPFAQLDAIRNYVVERAHRELDAVQWQIFIRTCPEKFERLRRRFERAQIYYSLPGSGDPRLPVPNFGG